MHVSRTIPEAPDAHNAINIRYRAACHVFDNDAHNALIPPDKFTPSTRSSAESKSSHTSIEEPQIFEPSDELGELILQAKIPYKHSYDADPVQIYKAIRGKHGVITARPQIGHHLATARLNLPHGSAFLKVDNDRKTKVVTVSVSDPATCLHTFFQHQTLRQADMRQILATVHALLAKIEVNAENCSRTYDAQEADMYKIVRYKKALPD